MEFINNMYNYMIDRPEKLFWTVMFFVVVFIIDFIYTIFHENNIKKRIKTLEEKIDFYEMIMYNDNLYNIYSNIRKMIEE